MKQHRTSAQWSQLLAQRQDFSGSNIEFCKHHGIAVTSYYKQRAIFSTSTETHFVKVTHTTKSVEAEQLAVISLQTAAGKLDFPSDLAPHIIIDIIKGLSQ